MTRPIRITRHAYGPRVYVLGLRAHHGSTGALVIIAARTLRARAPRAARVATFAGALALAHDWRDFPFTDARNHAPRRANRKGR